MKQRLIQANTHVTWHLPSFLRGLTQEQIALLGALVFALALIGLTQPVIVDLLLGQIRGLRFRSKKDSIQIGKEWVSNTARLRHAHIVGATGTGKTVLIESLLFSDLKKGYGALVIDPKGERGFYDSVKAYCASIGRSDDLYFLSPSFPEESGIWNPCALGSASELQTKFYNSSIYNEPHYAKACEFGLIRAFQTLTRGQSKRFNIRDLIRVLGSLAEEEKSNLYAGLFYDLNNLIAGEWEGVLGCSRSSGSQQNKEISLLDVVSQNKILFVDLPTEGKKVQSGRIGRLLTQEIILISGMRKRDPLLKSDRPFSVYIDEFDAFATESFSTFLNKGRSSEFMIHLAHQTLSDLNAISPEFTGQILGNCNVRFIFRQDDPDDAERWARFIGTQSTIKSTYRVSGGSKTGESSSRETREFLVSPDEIKSLRIGECIFSLKTEGRTRRLKVPFRKSKEPALSAPTQINSPQAPATAVRRCLDPSELVQLSAPQRADASTQFNSTSPVEAQPTSPSNPDDKWGSLFASSITTKGES